MIWRGAYPIRAICGATSTTIPRVGVVVVGVVGAGTLYRRAVVVHVCPKEGAKPVLLRVGAVPAAPTVHVVRNEFRPPGGVVHVLLAHEVHVDERSRGCRLGDSEQASAGCGDCDSGCCQSTLEWHGDSYDRVAGISSIYSLAYSVHIDGKYITKSSSITLTMWQWQNSTPFSTSKKHGGGNLKKDNQRVLSFVGMLAHGTRADVRMELRGFLGNRFGFRRKIPPNRN